MVEVIAQQADLAAVLYGFAIVEGVGDGSTAGVAVGTGFDLGMLLITVTVVYWTGFFIAIGVMEWWG